MKTTIIKRWFSVVFLLMLGVLQSSIFAQGTIIDHRCTDVTRISEQAINDAKANLHIAYGHTSHGSQLIDGMNGLISFANGGGLGLSLSSDIFKWNNGGTDGALDLHDNAMAGDCGYYPQWVNNTKNYLDDTDNSDVNVIIWSWCGQASGYSEQDMITKYLSPMAQLERDYPNVTFVYMTGHLDGTGESGNLHQRNQQIRQFCIDSNKVLYDFNDIESYDPDGVYYGDKKVNDACDYDSDGDGSRDKNWAVDWQNSHTKDTDWYDCSAAHSQPLNANRKAYAAWWLWASLAGWDTVATRLEGDLNLPKQPDSFILLENYPNPFNPVTTIHYKIKAQSDIELAIYDIQGRKISTLFSGKQNAGDYYHQWNAGRVSSGEYICRLKVDKRTEYNKIVLLK
jgi:hypothetical protein